MAEMKTYVYKGAVMEYDRVIDQYWEAETTAISPKKAKSNLAYRFKKMNGLVPSAKIALPGKIFEI